MALSYNYKQQKLNNGKTVNFRYGQSSGGGSGTRLGNSGGNADNPYGDAMTSSLNKLNSIDKFTYDQKKDPLYQQYSDMYQKNAKLNMQNTMGQASALAGGYGTSYGAMAGSTAYAQTMNNMNDKALDLYNASMNAYNTNADLALQQANASMSAYAMAQDQANADREFAENQRQYNQNLAYQYANLNEDQRQFNQNLAENQRQYDSDMTYKNNALAQDNDQFSRELMYKDAVLLNDKNQWEANLDEEQRQYDANLLEEQRQFNKNFKYQSDADKKEEAYKYMSQGYEQDENGNWVPSQASKDAASASNAKTYAEAKKIEAETQAANAKIKTVESVEWKQAKSTRVSTDKGDYKEFVNGLNALTNDTARASRIASAIDNGTITEAEGNKLAEMYGLL